MPPAVRGLLDTLMIEFIITDSFDFSDAKDLLCLEAFLVAGSNAKKPVHLPHRVTFEIFDHSASFPVAHPPARYLIALQFAEIAFRRWIFAVVLLKGLVFVDVSCHYRTTASDFS